MTSNQKSEDPAQGPVSNRAVSCGNCGYRLQGLSPGGNCPECGKPIQESLSSARLQGSGAGWLNTIAEAARIAGIVELIWAGLQSWVIYDVLRLNVLKFLPALGPTVAFHDASLANTVAGAIAVWWVSTRLSIHEDEGQRSRRMWMRFLVVFAVLGNLALDVVPTAPHREAWRFWWTTLNLFACGQVWLLWNYLRYVARSIPDERLAHQCRSVGIGQVAGILFGATLHALTYHQSLLTEGFRIFGPLPGRLITVAYQLGGAIVLWRFARRMSTLATTDEG